MKIDVIMRASKNKCVKICERQEPKWLKDSRKTMRRGKIEKIQF